MFLQAPSHCFPRCSSSGHLILKAQASFDVSFEEYPNGDIIVSGYALRNGFELEDVVAATGEESVDVAFGDGLWIH